MAVTYEHVPHPRVAERKRTGPPKVADESVGLNGRIALLLTRAVGSMWCAYAFALLALVALPSAIKSGDMMVLIQWVSQTFIQLVMLSVIMVGQNIMGKAADTRAEMTYQDAEGIFAEARQIQVHLGAQDQTINATLDRVLALEGALRAQLARAGSSPQGSAPQGSAPQGSGPEGSAA